MLFDIIANYESYTPQTIVMRVFAVLIILFAAFPLHEYSHALTAKLLGDNTAEERGRLTLNPFRHIDPMGAISMALFGIGWAKPVPVNCAKCTKCKPKTAMAITAAAGPLSNILLSYVFMIIYKVVYGFALQDVVINGEGQLALSQVSIYPYIIGALSIVIQINIYLAVFNLLPIPPFDGSRLFLAFLPAKIYFKIMKYERVIMIVIMLLLFTGILSIPLNTLTDWLISGLDWATGYVDVLMGY